METAAPDATVPDARVVDAGVVRGWRAGLTLDALVGLAALDAGGVDRDGLDDAGRVELLRALEELKCAAAGAQAVVTAALDVSQRAGQAAAGEPARRLGRGVGAQVGLARRESPQAGIRHLGLAKALVTELPHTLAALVAGRITEWRAMVIARETACLSGEDRRVVDDRLAGTPGRVEALEAASDSRLVGDLLRMAQELDVQALVARRRRAEAERRVTGRPAPDTMMYLTALLPALDGVGVIAALTKDAAAAVAAGDPRTRDQIMADLLVARVTGREPATGATTATIDLVITDTALFDRDHRSDHHPEPGTHQPDQPGTVAEDQPDTVADEQPDQQPDQPVADDTVADDTVADDTVADDTVAGESDVTGWESAYLHGYGPVPADLVRELAARALDPHAAPVLLRRLYAHPATGALVGMESRARLFPTGLATWIRLRDRTCRTPWCNAPIRHTDHVVDHAAGGPTTATNGQGLCTACNHAKQAPGWRARPAPPDHGRRRHTVITTTPTGHTYTSTAPPLAS